MVLLTPGNFDSFNKDLLTPRNLLRLINSVYDPLGLIAPITIRLRLGFRNLFASTESISWDAPLMPGPDQDCWLSLIQMLIHSDRITFRRCTQPADAIGSGQLICFFDGSNEAFATVIYVRWQLTDGTVDVSLLCAKPKVTPLKRISTPRSELNGAVIAARLAHSAVRSLCAADVPLQRLWFIDDSECTR